MVRLFTTAVLLFCSVVFGQAKFEQNMGESLALWGQGNPTEASAKIERIASVEKNNWLPNYYIGMINTTEAFKPENREKAPALLEKAQKAVDEAAIISPNNAEIMVLQALVYTAWIVQDPMTNGMKYSNKAMEQYFKAQAIAPNNPRVVFCKAEFEIGGAKWSGADTKPLCAQVEKSIELFATFKPETALHPNWGLDRAKKTLENCTK
ncbi:MULTISPECIES: tetratricopeptide repeat protein [unclassified Flavobacterium]|uniref:tetratricopeptide repeat protein n=1 Tax=unclassified Flavobacterium TaxID=196869 RepID=UPI003622A797